MQRRFLHCVLAVMPVRKHVTPRLQLPLAAVGLLLALGGCVTSGAITDARSDFYRGQSDAALTRLDDGHVAERDRLIALMEGGLIAHVAGRIDDSIVKLREAADLSDRLDAVFVGEQATTLVVNDRASRYRGEYAELLWIRTVQMLNYLLLGDWQSASVEARQAIAIYERYGEPLANDLFSRVLGARVLQGVGEPDAAAIEYARAFEQSGGEAAIAALALVPAQQSGRRDDVERYDEALSRSSRVDTARALRAGEGSLLLLVATGQVPAKRAGNLFVPPDLRISFPYYPNMPNIDVSPTLAVTIDGERKDVEPVVTRLGTVAAESLTARGKQMAAKQALRVVAKQGIGELVANEDELLGAVVGAVLFLLEEADTRSWRTLPGAWSLIELPVNAGRHQLDVGAGAAGSVLLDVEISAGATSVIVLHDSPGGLQRIVPRASLDLLAEARSPLVDVESTDP